MAYFTFNCKFVLSKEIKLILTFNVHKGKVNKDEKTPQNKECLACFAAE